MNQQTKICPRCGKELDTQVKFCNECGYGFEQSADDVTATGVSQVEVANNSVDTQTIIKAIWTKIKEKALKYAPIVLFSLWAVLLWALYAAKVTTDPFGLSDANLYQALGEETYVDLAPVLWALLSFAIISNVYIAVLGIIQWKGNEKAKTITNCGGIALQLAVFICALVTNSKVIEFGADNGAFVPVVATFTAVFAALQGAVYLVNEWIRDRFASLKLGAQKVLYILKKFRLQIVNYAPLVCFTLWTIFLWIKVGKNLSTYSQFISDFKDSDEAVFLKFFFDNPSYFKYCCHYFTGSGGIHSFVIFILAIISSLVVILYAVSMIKNYRFKHYINLSSMALHILFTAILASMNYSKQHTGRDPFLQHTGRDMFLITMILFLLQVVATVLQHYLVRKKAERVQLQSKSKLSILSNLAGITLLFVMIPLVIVTRQRNYEGWGLIFDDVFVVICRAIAFLFGLLAAILYFRKKKVVRELLCASATITALDMILNVIFTVKYISEAYFYNEESIRERLRELAPYLVGYSLISVFAILCLVMSIVFSIKKEKAELKKQNQSQPVEVVSQD